VEIALYVGARAMGDIEKYAHARFAMI